MHKIDDKLRKVTERIHQAALQVGRNPQTVDLVAVSKTHPASAIAQAYAWGQRHFGENYLQEALDKKMQLTDLQDIEWHFIGPIQSNKTRLIAEHFSWVHSVDRLKIAQRLSEQRPVDLPPLNICIQVNVDEEETKSGVGLSELADLIAAIYPLPRLRLRGLMAIPTATDDRQQQQRAFAKVRQAMEQLNVAQVNLEQGRGLGYTLDTLSMGMSGDMEAAIAEGATFVRVGTDIFGTRA